MLSKKTRYAILALVSLAQRSDEGPVAISSIASAEKIPRRFLEAILLQLKNTGCVDSTRGKNGGYFLCVDAGEITLAQVITEFEGSVGLVACACDDYKGGCEFCKEESKCRIRFAFREVYKDTLKTLSETTIASLI